MSRKAKTYGEIRFDPVARQWVISNTDPHISLRIKDIFRRLSKVKVGEFRFPYDTTHCYELLWFMDRFPLRASAADLALLKKGRKSFLGDQQDLQKILSGEVKLTQYPGLADGCELWEFQQIAVEMFRMRLRMLLGDDMGLGKTNTAIGCMLVPGCLPCAVVCEVHVTQQWADRIQEFSNLKVHVIKSTRPYPLPSADIYIFSYSKIDGWTDVVAHGADVPVQEIRPIYETEQQQLERLAEKKKREIKAGKMLPASSSKPNGSFFKFLVWDEPQQLRTGTGTDKGKAAEVFVAAIPRILGLTATPVMNYGIDMYNVMHFIVPGMFGTKDEFMREWCEGDDKRVADPDALGSFLIEQQVMLRRSEEDVDRAQPQPNVQTHYVDYDESKAQASEELAYTLAIKATSGSFMERGSAARELDALTRLATGVAKAVGVADYVKILLEADLPVLLSGWHRDVYDIWQEELSEWNPLLFTGSENQRTKERNKNAFISGESNLLIISNRSGAGLDGLQARCQDVVFGELDWSPLVLKQILGRIRRFGQEHTVNAHYMIANGGSDPLMVETLGVKSSQAHGIMNPHSRPKSPQNNESRMRKLAEMVIQKREAKLLLAA